MMMQRPLAISIIGWFLIVTGGLSALMMPLNYFTGPEMAELMAQYSSLPAGVQIAIGTANTLLQLLSGVGILKGAAWSRWLYVAVNLIGLAVTLLFGKLDGKMMMPGLVVFVLICAFLFGLNTSRWFRRRAH